MSLQIVNTLKFNPSTSELFAGNGQLIKKLQCPYRIDWDSLNKNLGDSGSRQCSQCSHSIIDAGRYSAESLLEMLAVEPGTCLKISLTDPNVQIIHGKHRRSIR